MTATTEPTAITAGDTVSWLKTLADYSAADGWALAYTLINANAKITLGSTASGSNHLVSASADTTSAWAAGSYTWQATVTKAAERHTIGTGTLTIAPDLAGSATPLDTRTSARQALDVLDAALATYGNKAYTQSYEISGRKMQFTSPTEFMSFRSKVAAEVVREENARRISAGLAPRNQLSVRFNTR